MRLCSSYQSGSSHSISTEDCTGASKMMWFAALLVLGVVVPGVNAAIGNVAWCYHEPQCNDTTWPTIAANYCNGSRQSPINIVTDSAKPDSNLTAFTFTNYDSTTGLKKMENTGKTIKVTLNDGIKVSGGDLPEEYDSLQFHLHWGNGASVPGSEHTVDGKRYPMELHIVNSKASHGKNTTLAIADSTGLAALGFFIEEKTGSSNEPASWQTLTSYLKNISEGGQSVNLTSGISLDDLLQGVDRTKYYRYLGSLTTPTCNEAVVWTLFKDSIKVSKGLIDLFSTTLHVSNSSSPLMVNVYRSIQPEQSVTTQSTSAASATCYSLGLMALSLVLGRS